MTRVSITWPYGGMWYVHVVTWYVRNAALGWLVASAAVHRRVTNALPKAVRNGRRPTNVTSRPYAIAVWREVCLACTSRRHLQSVCRPRIPGLFRPPPFSVFIFPTRRALSVRQVRCLSLSPVSGVRCLISLSPS